MTTHTPGPWRIDWNISRLDVFAEGGRQIARLLRSTKDGAPTFDDAEAKANARLIAAAPDLLEVAQAVVARWDTPSWKDAEPTAECIGKLRAAISKATGEQP